MTIVELGCRFGSKGGGIQLWVSDENISKEGHGCQIRKRCKAYVSRIRIRIMCPIFYNAGASGESGNDLDGISEGSPNDLSMQVFRAIF